MRKNHTKRGVGRRALSVFLSICLFIGAFSGFSLVIESDTAKADDKVKIKITGGKVLDETKENLMNVGELGLEIQSPDISFSKPDDYRVEWGIQTGEGSILTMGDPSSPNKFRKNIYAVAPGDASIYVNVYKVEATGETTVGNASCVIRVVFGIDTSNDNDFDNVYESDEDKSLIMYTNSPQKQLKLNFGDVADTTWRSLNSEVASVSSAGKVTAIGAGYTQIEAEYTQPGTTETFTAYLGVYVIPMVSATNGSGYSTGPTIPVDDGGYIYTDTVFTNNIDPIRNKIYWEIKVESTGGNQVIIANSAGMDSELISLSPTNSHSNQMQVTGVAGTYYVYFYAYNRSHASEITEVKYTPTVATITIKSAIKHKDIVLGIGDYLDLAKSFNMTLSDFKSYFTPSFTDTVGPENYATLDKNKMTVKGVREGKVKIKLEINKSPIDMEPKVKALLGLNEDDPFPNDNKPPFILTITIVDGITLGEEAVVISVKQTYQLVATLHGTYSGDIKWNSSDNSYVTVDDTGMITGVKVTTTDVTVTASVQIAGGITRTASCVVKVENAVTDFTLSPPGDKYMDVGEVLTLEAKIKETVSVAPLRWISSKEEVFTVTPAADKKTAVINAIAGGSGTLMVENTLNGKRVQIDITVRIPITSLEFSEEDYKFPFYQNGHNMKEELKIEPSDATTTKLKWTVDNTSVATIDDAGYLKFKAPGTVLVTVRPEHNPNALLPQVVVKIIGGPEEIIFENLKDDHLDIEAGETKTVNLKFVPATAETKLIWKTDKAGIVLADYNDEKRTVDIIGRAPGNVTVTCRTEDNVYYSFTVTVKQASSGIEFPETAITLYRGDPVKGIYQLKPILKPETSTDTVTYKMRDDKIASVDENGLVTGLAAGTTYVMATTSSGKTNVVDVTVIDMVTALESDFRSAVVYIGETLTISPTVVPDTAANKNIKWYWEPHEPGGTAEVELTEKGSSVDVVGKSKGLVMLTGESVDNPAAKVTYILNVKYRNPQYNTTVILTPKTKYVNVGKKFKVTRTVKNAYKGNKKLKWKSSNKKVATVNSKGVVKAKKVGKATITATAQDGSKAKGKMKLIVRRQVTKLKMNRTSANILIGKSIRLRVSVTPSNATVKGVKWKSGDTAIATVDGGKVIGVGVGMVKITATSKDTTKKKCYCWVTVSEPVAVTNFTIPDANITVAKGNSVQSGIVPNPTNATDSIKFWSDNPSVASVTSRGKIKAKKVGKATIYARAANGVEGHVDVTVVDLNRKAVTLRQYDTEQLSVNMISTGVTWYSASPNIASVDANGLVKARMPGVTIIYANVDGVKLGCKVTVKRIT